MTLSEQRLSTLGGTYAVAPLASDAIAPIERLPKWLLCAPIGAQLIWQGLRYRSLTLPSVLNPSIENGGLVGESKFSYLRQVGAPFRHLIADTVLVQPGDDIEQSRASHGLAFPLIAKPDIGWCGYGVRRIETSDDLRRYAASFPPAAILLQALAIEPNEAGVHYVRREGSECGRIEALTIRHPPLVTGDGMQSVGELIQANPRTRTKFDFYRQLLSDDFRARVPLQGEQIVLTTVASVRVGGRYEDATNSITPALAEAVDGLCRSMDRFEYGRLDVRYRSLEDLRNGRFKVIEINGAGSEAIQFWDPKLPMTEAFAGVFRKQRELFAMANELRAAGRRPVGVRAILHAHFRQQRLIKAYPPSN